MPITIRPMQADDAPRIAAAFAAWHKTLQQYVRYYAENVQGLRVTVVAIDVAIDVAIEPGADAQAGGVQVVGYSNVIWQPTYAPFAAQGIPEINDLNVLEAYQKQGIGRALIGACEHIVAAAGKHQIGIGYGLTPDYAAAQRLYPQLGYGRDGRGRQPTPWGDVEFLVKQLPPAA